MPDLIAQGLRPEDRWRRHVPSEGSITLGRTAEPWAVPWDDLISRQHATLRWKDGRLTVQKLASGRNAIFFRGSEASSFEILPGEHFVIGHTNFVLTDEQANVSIDHPQPVQEHSYASEDLQRVRFRNADQRLDVLSRLPEVISGAATDTELFVRLVNMLLAGILRADAAAVVAVRPGGDGSHAARVLHWDRRLNSGGEFRPSQRLIIEAVTNRRQSVAHVWGGARPTGPQANFTVNENFDWAFCTPISGDACPGWALYVAGRFQGAGMQASTADSADLRDDVKFTELVSEILNSLKQIRLMQRKQATLSRFLSPKLVESVPTDNPERFFAPREADVAVLFCDLRSFSREAEKHGQDLLGLLGRVSDALGVMTQHILEQGGVIGDFQGDAAMGFWGWPLEQDDRFERAAQAALAIRRTFRNASKTPGHPLADFRMGIGIASGRAVAGEIGSRDQGKVTVFGPVVNLASRLEGMTKILHAPILMDELTAERVRSTLVPEQARCRTVGRFRPYGLDTPLTITELLSPLDEDPGFTDADVKFYEQAVQAFTEGNWPQAFTLLHRVTPEDVVKDFLTVFIAKHNRQAPSEWDGVITLESKS